MNNSDYEERLKLKRLIINNGISALNGIKELLFTAKNYFYGDFKYSEDLKKVPHPRALIQDAIGCLEQALREAYLIEINSV